MSRSDELATVHVSSATSLPFSPFRVQAWPYPGSLQSSQPALSDVVRDIKHDTAAPEASPREEAETPAQRHLGGVLDRQVDVLQDVKVGAVPDAVDDLPAGAGP